jgi:hypothetical protein
VHERPDPIRHLDEQRFGDPGVASRGRSNDVRSQGEQLGFDEGLRRRRHREMVREQGERPEDVAASAIPDGERPPVGSGDVHADEAAHDDDEMRFDVAGAPQGRAARCSLGSRPCAQRREHIRG